MYAIIHETQNKNMKTYIDGRKCDHFSAHNY